MPSTNRSLSVTLPVTGISHCPEDEEWVCCLSCGVHLGLTQPDEQEPKRMVGTCKDCGRWYLLDWHPLHREGVMILLPDHDSLLRDYRSLTPDADRAEG